MADCKNLIHPFQNDPGVSQGQRIMDDLLSGPAKIDGRSLADLLDYFMQLSRHINYYDGDLSISDWQPFFQKSVPFSIAAITKYDTNAVNEQVDYYHKLFEKDPSPSGLQLLVHYMFYTVIYRINTWHLQVEGSELPVAFTLEKLIKDRLKIPTQQFIALANAAVKWYCIKTLDWQSISNNPVWDLDITDLYAVDESFKDLGDNKRERLIALYEQILTLLPAYLDVIQVVTDAAVISIEPSLFPLKEALQERHPAHLAILFAFLKLFEYLQQDLNSFTKKHLDFFYKQVLKLQSKEAVPDSAHIVFEIQNQLDKYLLQNGIQVKDGKDNNKAEVFFSLDDEIVVNKTQIADKRTLFLNYQTYPAATYLEGVYMAPNAGKADGVDKDFKEDAPKSFATLGAKNSKYIDPENKFVQPYPNARLGFILASPVLLLNEGQRTVTITLSCRLDQNYCLSIEPQTGVANPCCSDYPPPGGKTPSAKITYPDFAQAGALYNAVSTIIGQSFYYINRDGVVAAVKQGISKDMLDKLNQLLTIRHIKSEADRRYDTDQVDPTICYCPIEEKVYEITVPEADFNNVFNETERGVLKDIFQPRKAFKVSFSGEKEWIVPKPGEASGNEFLDIEMGPLAGDRFVLTIVATLQPDQKAVTFYNAENLKEDFNTALPVVKIELDDKIKLTEDVDADGVDEACCERKPANGKQPVSLYHFFRNVFIADDDQTKIRADVCGLKNFVVQNNESLQNVNAPIYPFGTRPTVIDFDVNNPPPSPVPHPAPNLNLKGPDFYIGSQEVFGKKWSEIYINLNWKDKPTNFNEYYKGYLVRDNYHECDDLNDNTHHIYGLNECDFQMNLALLQDGQWIKEKLNPPFTTTALNEITGDNNRLLFASDVPSGFCTPEKPFAQTIKLIHDEAVNPDPQFDLTPQFNISSEPLTQYDVNSRNNFLRINLQNQDFLHKDYSYVLARQMMAFGRYPDLVNDAVYIEGGVPQVFDISIFFGNIGPQVIQIANDVVNSAIDGVLDDLVQIISDETDSGTNVPFLNDLLDRSKELLSDVAALAAISIPTLFGGFFDVGGLSAADQVQVKTLVKDFVSDLFDLFKTDLSGIEDSLKAKLRDKFDDILATIDVSGFFTGIFGSKEVIIPNEPWTPIVEEMSIDYSATAPITDIDLIHLYPYTGTYKSEEFESQPSLFPVFCDEGNLFLGLKDLRPGNNLNVLFQLAEATADSESEKQLVQWYYLQNNQWKLLRNGFEVLDDATDGLTTSGIIKFATPTIMTSDNTILPKELFWIKAAISQNSRSVSETVGIHTQAIRVTFTNETANDKLRLIEALPAGSIAKLKVADASIKKVNQPYDSYGGRVPEAEGHFYVRVSEQLRHKGRAIQKFDYERLALETFPQLFKVKCINHSFALDAHKYLNDFPMAPGYVILAVIPDLNQLRAIECFEPRVPVSLLDKIKMHLMSRTSPFVRLKIMNPRYEKVHFCLQVKLYLGKDENFYKEKLKQDLKEFLAPWAVGQYDKLSFGQCVYRSDIVRFLETRDYLDYIIDLGMKHESEPGNPTDQQKVCPITPRSILIAGDIDVCIQQQDCEAWQRCYDENQREKECCPHDKILLAKYCKEDIPPQ